VADAAPPGYLSYGPLNLTREQTCHNCKATFLASSGRGTAHWCPDCRGGEAHRAYQKAYMKAYRKRAKR
jgi:hypothetical protein